MESTKLRLSLTNDALGGAAIADARVHEALSTPTTANVTVLVDEPIDPKALVGTKATLTALVDDAPARTWDLLVVAVQFESERGRTRLAYSIQLAHPLALLSYRTDVRMFQKMSVQDMVNDVLQRAALGLSPAWHLKRSLSPRVYCVQYRETDFQFVKRLLEHEGIFFICNDGDGDGLTLADDPSAFTPIDGDATVAFVEGEHGAGVHQLDVDYAWITDKVTLRDWNHETPLVQLEGTTTVGSTVMSEAYEFPGGFSQHADAGPLAQVRAEQLASQQAVGTGLADNLAFRPGRTFTLTDTSRDSLNTSWALREVTHSFAILQLEREREEDARRRAPSRPAPTASS